MLNSITIQIRNQYTTDNWCKFQLYLVRIAPIIAFATKIWAYRESYRLFDRLDQEIVCFLDNKLALGWISHSVFLRNEFSVFTFEILLLIPKFGDNFELRVSIQHTGYRKKIQLSLEQGNTPRKTATISFRISPTIRHLSRNNAFPHSNEIIVSLREIN